MLKQFEMISGLIYDLRSFIPHSKCLTYLLYINAQWLWIYSSRIHRTDSSSVVNGPYYVLLRARLQVAIGGSRRGGRIQKHFQHLSVAYSRNSAKRRQRVVVVVRRLVVSGEPQRRIGGACAEGTHYFHNGDGGTAVLWFVLMSLWVG
jgi:hypothetical protein